MVNGGSGNDDSGPLRKSVHVRCAENGPSVPSRASLLYVLVGGPFHPVRLRTRNRHLFGP